MLPVLSHNSAWLQYGGAVLTCDPYNPLDLPPFTMRLKLSISRTPEFDTPGVTATFVRNSDPVGYWQIWDITYENSDWSNLLMKHRPDGETSGVNPTVLEVIGANTTGVTSMYALFSGQLSMYSVCLFDTSAVRDARCMFNEAGWSGVPGPQSFLLTDIPPYDFSSLTHADYMFRLTGISTCPPIDMSHVLVCSHMFEMAWGLVEIPWTMDLSSVWMMDNMFYDCISLKTIPQITLTNSVSNVDRAFYHCTKVESGLLSFYNSASQSTSLLHHDSTFTDCGVDTTTGAAELAQIPYDWK